MKNYIKYIGVIGLVTTLLVITIKNKQALIKTIDSLIDSAFINPAFQTPIDSIKRLRRWRIPLYENGIYSMEDLIEEVNKKGFENIKNFQGIGEVGLLEIRTVIYIKTKKYVKIPNFSAKG